MPVGIKEISENVLIPYTVFVSSGVTYLDLRMFILYWKNID